YDGLSFADVAIGTLRCAGLFHRARTCQQNGSDQRATNRWSIWDCPSSASGSDRGPSNLYCCQVDEDEKEKEQRKQNGILCADPQARQRQQFHIATPDGSFAVEP